MKEKPVDTTLISRIRQVFDNFEDPTAEDGWQELRKKFPKSNRRPIFLWIASTAAILLIATSLWFVKNESNPVEKTALRKPITKQKGIVADDKALSFSGFNARDFL
jgi:hypothetical protein